MDEAKKDYIDRLGQDLGEVFHALWQQLAWLQVIWAEYKVLFG